MKDFMVPIILSPTSDLTKNRHDHTMDFHLNGGSQIWFLENQNFGIGKNVMTIMFRIKNNPRTPIFSLVGENSEWKSEYGQEAAIKISICRK